MPTEPTQRTDPPFVAGEEGMLLAFLDYHRATLRLKTEDLTTDQLRERLGPGNLTLGGLLAHLALVESYWFGFVLAGEAPRRPWASADWDADPDWDFHLAASLSAEDLRGLFDAQVAASDDVLRVRLPDGLDQLSAGTRGGEHPSLRYILVHLVEEYARHNGHADLLREAVDGTTGE